ncbi:MerR family transcriptional regulator [Craterilacuibacter sp. RT1T]|uniref:MerR family transcriptional regulator n=1 Tax=Craterilacuibacter sp. RT1T TaxID=2942211 RepID=UPI0020C13FD9|nr:MerR family transcriptional regulator [Craterilacuibacter sp. RT1T]MCL6262441.1 cobalamin B12-binding domain-containing protein [Craterilacuibacter sp. RT1T]
MSMPGLPIAAVERETGIARQLLRMWERRYGYPMPLRDAQGDRLYPPEQVTRLCQIRRLIDMGLRPGRLMALTPAQLEEMAELHLPKRETPPLCDGLLDLLRHQDGQALRQDLQQRLQAMGLAHFVCVFLPQANALIGDAWSRGEIRIYHEHLYTEALTRLLREALSALPSGTGRPRIMLTSTPAEPHTLGLLMAEALLRLAGCECLAFGPCMPFAEMGEAMIQHRIDVLALSFSVAYNGPLDEEIGQLMASIPPASQLWVGGAGTRRLKLQVPGLHIMQGLEQIERQVAQWRSAPPV